MGSLNPIARQVQLLTKKEKHMLTCIIVFLVGAHLGAKYPEKATLIVDKSVALVKAVWAKLAGLVAKK
jgi:hypothetical protein